VISFTKAFKLGKALPDLPSPRKLKGRIEIQEVEAFIRSVGGNPMRQLTKHRLAKAGCSGFPED
jgi:hypothetical protein